MQDNPLWQYSLAFYNRPGVESLMIMLQDSYQADVNMLLCCGWLGREGQQLSLDSMRLLVDVSMPWQQHCVQPLRACLLYTSPSPRDLSTSRMPSSA